MIINNVIISSQIVVVEADNHKAASSCQRQNLNNYPISHKHLTVYI